MTPNPIFSKEKLNTTTIKLYQNDRLFFKQNGLSISKWVRAKIREERNKEKEIPINDDEILKDYLEKLSKNPSFDIKSYHEEGNPGITMYYLSDCCLFPNEDIAKRARDLLISLVRSGLQ